MASHAKKNTVTAQFQIIAFLITTILLSAIFYYPFVTFYGFDDLPKVKEFSTQVSSNNPTVNMGLLINNFSEFKIEEGQFVFEGSVWFQYDPKKISLEKIKQFHLINGEIKTISDPDVRKVGDDEIAQFEIIASLKNNLNYSAFPLDDHYISIGIFNYALPDGTVVSSELNDFDLDPSLHIPGWKILSRQLKIGYVDRIFGKKDLQGT